MFLKIFNQILQHSFEHKTKVLPEDGTIDTETCRKVSVIIHVFYCICAYCWCFTDRVKLRACSARFRSIRNFAKSDC